VGTHTATAYADGNAIGSAQFTVSTLGVEFLTGAQGTINIGNFPAAGKRASLTWQQATQNFAISDTTGTPAVVTGTYTGNLLGTKTSCGSSNGQVNPTDVQFAMNQSGDSVTIQMTIPNSTPSSCTLAGTLLYNASGAQHSVQGGGYTCNDGSTGQWTSSLLLFGGPGFTAQSTLTGTNGCVANLKMAGARN
jgi:hypothetical protein